MNLYFAPMEGLTGYVYRNAHRACFGGVDKYFTPFLSPNQNHKFTAKEEKDVLPEHNQGIPLVPQILTNRAEDFIWAAGEMKARGYREVNLNLGCPSGTVVSKYKGAGFLARQEALNRFLDQIFQEVDLGISVKTRIGIAAPEEFPELMEIFNRYPIRELTVHPRLRTDFYKNTPDWESFGYAVKESRAPLCYNGDVFTAEAFRSAAARFPSVGSVMLGRGLLANPALAGGVGGG
ncbi:MAG: tRNA-dihydrouridine synthase family protein, partial [Enterocloster asparagiformis]|nr:tRNA-dihydrouridine synthase family protein [Enterocloster asparagiformis]